jgi:hypothetical protein
MLEEDSPEVIIKTGNKTIKKMKTQKKDPGKQNSKRPVEAAGSFTKFAHDGGNAVNYNATQPFRAMGVPRLLRIPRQTTSPTNAEVMDIGPEIAERPTTAVHSKLAGHLLCKKTNRDFFLEVDNVENLDIFYEYEFGVSDINVKGRLKKSVEFWQQIGTSKFILDVIKEGYKIVLLHKLTAEP